MKQRPLATYLTGVNLMAVLPFVLLSAWWMFDSVRESGAEVRAKAQGLVHNSSNAIDNYLEGHIRALSMLANSPLADDPADWSRLYLEAQNYQRIFGSHVVFSDVADPMEMRFNTRVPFGAELPPLPRPKGTAAAPRALETGRPAVGDSFVGPIADETLVAVVVPGVREGEVTHLMLSTLATEQLQEHLATLSLPEGWLLTVRDGRGDLLAHRGGGSIGDASGEVGEQFRATSALSPWVATLSLPASALTVPLTSLAARLTALIIIATIAGIICGSLAARRLSRQLAVLADPKLPGTSSSIREIAAIGQQLDAHAAQLEASEASHRELFEVNPHPMWVHDLKTLTVLAVNDAAVRQYGYSRDDFMRMSIKDIYPPEDIPRLLSNVEQTDNRSEAPDNTEVWQHITRDGRKLDVQIQSHHFYYDGQLAELVLAHDITDRLRAEAALRNSEAEFRTLIETMPQIVWVTRPDGWHLVYNRHWLEFTGLTLEESLGHGWNPAFHPEDQSRAARKWEQALATGEPYEIEYRLRRSDGTYRWMLGRALPLRGSTGQIEKWFGTCTDIHELKHTEGRLTEAQSIARIGDFEFVVATEAITWSPQVYEIMGRDPEVGTPQSLEENAILFVPSSRPLLSQIVERAIATGDPQEADLVVEHPTGMEVHVRAVVVLRKDPGSDVIRGTIQDISEQKRVERALLTRVHQQVLVADFGRSALTANNIGQVAKEAVTLMADGLGVSYTKVLLCDPSRESYTLTAGVGWAPEWIGCEFYRNSEAHSQAEHVMASREPVVVQNFEDDSRFSPSPLLIQHRIVSGINVAIHGINGPLGIFGAYSRQQHSFSSDDISFMQSLANILSTAIERQSADERLAHMAHHDALTSLPNRFLLADRLSVALAEAERQDLHVALLFLDLDRFKNVNDVFGHAAGDQILQQVAERLGGVTRGADTVSRQGGDEFLIVVTGLRNDQEAALVAEKILDVFNTSFKVGGTEVVLTGSIGITCFPNDGREAEILMRNADAAMYVAKEQG